MFLVCCQAYYPDQQAFSQICFGYWQWLVVWRWSRLQIWVFVKMIKASIKFAQLIRQCGVTHDGGAAALIACDSHMLSTLTYDLYLCTVLAPLLHPRVTRLVFYMRNRTQAASMCFESIYWPLTASLACPHCEAAEFTHPPLEYIKRSRRQL